MTTDSPTPFERLQAGVIRPGLCTHCGLCAGLSGGTLTMVETAQGPLPMPSGPGPVTLPPQAADACPGQGIDYPALYHYTFGTEPQNWLLGPYRRVYIGHAADEAIRRRGASGGAITRTLIYLLEAGLIDGAVAVRQGSPRPWDAEAVIARTPEEVIACAQSVYRPVPVLAALAQMEAFEGRLALVGLPDQVAALRRLQWMGHPAALRVEYVLGPYTGTNMYFGAIESYLRANGVRGVEQIAELRYREGEWPGYLYIRLTDGRELKAEKFYYNYLIPFYITRHTLLAVDFANELTDISVGDAWSPKYEAKGQGFSVIVARSERGEVLLETMHRAGLLVLEEITAAEALAMHGHMLDFKKRGAFIRMDWRRARGKPVPDYGYRPSGIRPARRLVEVVIAGLFAICGTRAARRLAELIPIGVLGPLFDTLRRAWKGLSRPVKREGLGDYTVEITTHDNP
ncbi:MAG: hypothetical protein Kow00124_14210 [Anaerolineae bacterium]